MHCKQIITSESRTDNNPPPSAQPLATANVVELPMAVIETFIFVTILYWMVGSTDSLNPCVTHRGDLRVGRVVHLGCAQPDMTPGCTIFHFYFQLLWGGRGGWVGLRGVDDCFETNK